MDNLTTDIQLASTEAEQSLIGGILISNDAYFKCADIKSNMFAHIIHQALWQAITTMTTHNTPVDPLTLNTFIEQQGVFDNQLSYIVSIHQNTPSAANIRHYADIVKDRYSERQMLAVGEQIQSLATDRTGRSLSDRQAEAVKAVTEIAETAAETKHERTVVEAVEEMQAELEMLSRLRPGELMGYGSSLNKIDEITHGFRKGELIVIGGRTSMGKSVLAENIARHNAKKGFAIRYQSYEMPAKDLMKRSASAEKNINFESFRTARFQAGEVEKYHEFVAQAEHYNMILDTDPVDVDRLAARCRVQKRKTGLDMLVVDHLHLVQRVGKNAVEELGAITRVLKLLAIELNIPIILLAQLNRESAKEVIPPRLTDLRSSGAIEQDADVIILIHRPSFYDNDLNPYQASINIAKNRNGRLCEVLCGFVGKHQKFTNEVPHWEPDFKPKFTQQRVEQL